MLPKFKTQSGISLIEIVISLMMVGFVILIIANIPQAMRLITSSSHESLAKDIVTKKIEDLRNQGYSLLSDGTTPFNGDNPGSLGYDSRIDNLPFGAGTIVVSQCPSCSTSEQIKQVEVRVTWNESGKIKNVDVYTLIAGNGLQ